jgi:hypothetical protein
MTYISPSIAEKLGLIQGISIRAVADDGEEKILETYIGDLYFPDFGFALPTRQMAAFKRQNPNVDGLLGRDILNISQFFLDGPNRVFTLALPQPEPDDCI